MPEVSDLSSERQQASEVLLAIAALLRANSETSATYAHQIEVLASELVDGLTFDHDMSAVGQREHLVAIQRALGLPEPL